MKNCTWCGEKIKAGIFVTLGLRKWRVCDRVCSTLSLNHHNANSGSRPVIGTRGPEWLPANPQAQMPSMFDLDTDASTDRFRKTKDEERF